MRVPVPLAGLRALLDDGSARAHWSIEPDGIRGRAWVIVTAAPVTVRLILDSPVRLTAVARLTPHDWRDSVGGIDVSLTVTTAGGDRRRVWASALTPAGDPDGASIDCLLPADTASIAVSAEPRATGHRSTSRFLLIDPYLTDPRAPAPSPRGAHAPPCPAEGPMISVLCPVHDPPDWMLQAAIASVLDQTYQRWELVLVDDGSTDADVIGTLDDQPARDPRISLLRRPAAGGIATASNAALAQADGEYVATLDHDDVLDRHALAYVADAINRDADLDMVYTDEAVLDDGRLTTWHRKPAWSPETIEARMYTTHLSAYRRSLAEELGGFRSEFDGTQDYDFVLRLGDRTDRIAHVPEVLYYWRSHAGSTAAGAQAKPRAYVAQLPAIADHLRRCGRDAEAQYGPRPGIHRIVHRADREATVSVVVLARETDALLGTIKSWVGRSAGSRVELVISVPTATHELITRAVGSADLHGTRAVVCARAEQEPAGAALQAAVARASGRHLLLMDAPMRGLTHGWLTRLVAYSAQPGIAAAAPIVLSDDDRIAHAGIAIPDGLPLPILHGSPGPSAPEGAFNAIAADGVIAVTARTLERLDGLSPRLNSTAITDLCLRAGEELRLRTVIVDDVRLRRTDRDPGTNDLSELWMLGERFSRQYDRDPYYSPSFRTDRADFQA